MRIPCQSKRGRFILNQKKRGVNFYQIINGLYPADSAKRVRHRKGSKGLAKATSQTFPFCFDYLGKNPL